MVARRDVRAGGEARLCRCGLPRRGRKPLRAGARLVAGAGRGGGGAASGCGLAAGCHRPQPTRAADDRGLSVQSRGRPGGDAAHLGAGGAARRRPLSTARPRRLPGLALRGEGAGLQQAPQLAELADGGVAGQPRSRAVELSGGAVAGPDHRRRQAQRADRALDQGAGRCDRALGACRPSLGADGDLRPGGGGAAISPAAAAEPAVAGGAAASDHPGASGGCCGCLEGALAQPAAALDCAAGGRTFAALSPGRCGGVPAGRGGERGGERGRRFAAGDDERAHAVRKRPTRCSRP